VSNSTQGAVAAATKITGSVGKGVAALSMDKAYLLKRQQIGSKDSRYLMKPLEDIGYGLYHGVTGVVTSPYQGFKRNGIRRAVLGFGKGVAGLTVKPVVGVLNSVTHTGYALREGARLVTIDKRGEPVRRCKLPNVFGTDTRLLLPYSIALARGAYVLKQLYGQDED
jgi:vacuolar protein sorting-associated protein 13A/C